MPRVTVLRGTQGRSSPLGPRRRLLAPRTSLRRQRMGNARLSRGLRRVTIALRPRRLGLSQQGRRTSCAMVRPPGCHRRSPLRASQYSQFGDVSVLIAVRSSSVLAYACGHPSCWPQGATSSQACYATSKELNDHQKVEHAEDFGGSTPFRCGLPGCKKSWKVNELSTCSSQPLTIF